MNETLEQKVEELRLQIAALKSIIEIMIEEHEASYPFYNEDRNRIKEIINTEL